MCRNQLQRPRARGSPRTHCGAGARRSWPGRGGPIRPTIIGGHRNRQRGPGETEEMRVVRRRAVHGQVSENLADTRAELVAVSGEAGSDNHVLVSGHHINDEVLVWRVHEHAGLEAHRWSHCYRQVALEPGKSFHVFRDDGPIDGVGIDRFVAMMVLADLEAFVSPFRKPVEYTRFRTIEDEHWKCGRCEMRPRRFEPADDLPFRDCQRL